MQLKSTPSLAPATTYPAIIGRVLNELRSKAGMTQAQLAGAVGITNSTWSRIERGESALTMDQFVVAARALKVLPSDIQICADIVAARVALRGIEVAWRRWEVSPTVADAARVGIPSDALAPFAQEALAELQESKPNPAKGVSMLAQIFAKGLEQPGERTKSKPRASTAGPKAKPGRRAKKTRST